MAGRSETRCFGCFGFASGLVCFYGRFDGKDIDLDCGVGTLTVTAAGKEADYNYRIDCGIGTIQVGSKSFSGLDRSQTIDNQAGKTVSADCGIGKITLDFE